MLSTSNVYRNAFYNCFGCYEYYNNLFYFENNSSSLLVLLDLLCFRKSEEFVHRLCWSKLIYQVLWGQEVRFPWFWLQGSEECFLQFRSVQFSHSVVSDPLWPHGLQHARPPCPSPTPRIYSNPCPLSRWCHPTISSSIVPFSSRLQSFPASRSFQISQLFATGDQSIGVSASTSVLPMNIQDWFPLAWTGWISWLSKGLSRIFSNTTVQKHQLFGAQVLLWKVAQLCPTLCNPMDCSLPGSTIHGIFQAGILEWVAISFSRRCSRSRDWTRVSHMIGIVGRCFTI